METTELTYENATSEQKRQIQHLENLGYVFESLTLMTMRGRLRKVAKLVNRDKGTVVVLNEQGGQNGYACHVVKGTISI